MKILFYFAFFLVGSFFIQPAAYSQSEEVSTSLANFFAAIEQKDAAALDKLVSKDLVYGHSSGVVQDKKAFSNEILSGKPFTYKNIQTLYPTVAVSGDVAIVRHTFTADAVNGEGAVTKLKIGNSMTWKKENGKWVLLGRQAYRLQ